MTNRVHKSRTTGCPKKHDSYFFLALVAQSGANLGSSGVKGASQEGFELQANCKAREVQSIPSWDAPLTPEDHGVAAA